MAEPVAGHERRLSGGSMALCARARRQEIVVETTSDWALSTPVLVTAVTAK